MVREWVRFLFTSCEESQTNERDKGEWVSDSSKPENIKIVQRNQPWSNMFIVFVLIDITKVLLLHLEKILGPLTLRTDWSCWLKCWIRLLELKRLPCNIICWLWLAFSCPFLFWLKGHSWFFKLEVFYNAVAVIFLYKYYTFQTWQSHSDTIQWTWRIILNRCFLIRWCMINSSEEFLLKTLDSPLSIKNFFSRAILCSVVFLAFSFSCPSGNSSSETLSANLKVPEDDAMV